MFERILPIDDDALMRRSLTFVLERAGYAVTLAASAEEGLARLVEVQRQLVLLDIGLPGQARCARRSTHCAHRCGLWTTS